jgi:hypothetical protein
MQHAVLLAVLLAASAGPVPTTTATPPAQASVTGKPVQARLSSGDEARLNAMIAQHERVRSRLPAEYQKDLDQLTIHVRKQLFAAPPRGKLLPAAAQIVGKAIPGLTTPEATSLAEYALGGIASGGSGQGQLLNATKQMQETQMSFNLQYLQLQSQMQNENRSYTAVSNVMKTKHETVKNSISNVR